MPIYDTPGSVSLQIKLPGGRVAVTTADEPRTSVELVPIGRRGSDALDSVEVSVEERAGGHVITVAEKDRIRWGPIRITWGADVEVRVVCPHGADLDVSGGSTDLRAEGRLGEVDVRTASGDVKLGEVGGDMRVKTASGDVSIGTIAAEASLATVSGDIGVVRLDGSLTARAVSGDVSIASLGGSVQLSTTSGDVELKSVERGEVRLQTVSGDVRIGVRRGTSVWIDATSVSGDLESKLGLEEEMPQAAGEVAVPLHVKTVSGDVSIVSAGEALPV